MSTEPSAQNKPGTMATVNLEIPLDRIAVTQAPPALLSQYSVEGHTGVPKRTYLEQTRDPGFPLPVSKVGKLRLVVTADYVAWLRGQGAAKMPPANDTDSEGTPTTAAGVLAELGLERVRGRR